MPAPGAAASGVDEREPRSASVIVGGDLVGNHLLHIVGYSRTKEKLPTGKSIESRPFSAGGHRWSIRYFPNGHTSDFADCVTIFLFLDKSASRPVKARAKFDLLDGTGNPMPSKSRTTTLCEFSPGSGHGFDIIKRELLEKSEHLLMNDGFKISCDVIIPMELRTEDRIVSQSLLDAVPPPDLNQHLGDLLMTKEGADVTFQVAGQSFSAHRFLLAARSRVFKAELCGAMKESTDTGIRIDDMLPQVFKALLHFIYTDSLPQMEKEEEALMAQHLLEAADRYDMQRLKLICEEKLCRHLDVSTAATTLVLAEQHYCCGLKKACIEFLKSSDKLEAVMETGGFEHLIKSCPALVKELISELCLFKQCKKRKLNT